MSAPELSTVPSPPYPGSRFVRADLHVHTHKDTEVDPAPDLARYVAAALQADIEILAVTDHNHVRFVRSAIAAAQGTTLTVLPGIEISTHDGHLLALFAADAVDALEALAHGDQLKLKRISETDLRSARSMLDLVEEIHQRGGLAIPAHIDASKGAAERLSPAELTELLTSPALAGIEFATSEALSAWFTDDDDDEHRRRAWKARQTIDELRERGSPASCPLTRTRRRTSARTVAAGRSRVCGSTPSPSTRSATQSFSTRRPAARRGRTARHVPVRGRCAL